MAPQVHVQVLEKLSSLYWLSALFRCSIHPIGRNYVTIQKRLTYICRGHGIQFLFVARIPALDRVQVERCRPMYSPSSARVDPCFTSQRTAKFVFFLFKTLSRLFVTLLLACFILEEMIRVVRELLSFGKKKKYNGLILANCVFVNFHSPITYAL